MKQQKVKKSILFFSEMIKIYFSKYGEIEDFRLIKENKKKTKDMKIYGFVLFKQKSSLEALSEEKPEHEIHPNVTLECKPTLLREELKEIQLKNNGIRVYTEEEKKLRKKLKKRIRRLKKKRDKLIELGKDVSEIEGVIKEEQLRMKNREFLEVQVEEKEEKTGATDLFRKVQTGESQFSKNIKQSDLMKLNKFYRKDYSGVTYLNSQPKVKTNFFKFACHDSVLSKLSDMEGKSPLKTTKSDKVKMHKKNSDFKAEEEGRPLSGFGYHRDIAEETQSEYLLRSRHMLFGSGFESLDKKNSKISKYFNNFNSDIPRTSDVLLFKQKSGEKSESLENSLKMFSHEDSELYSSKILGSSPIDEDKRKPLMDIIEDDLNYIDEEELDDEIEGMEFEISSGGKEQGRQARDIFGLIRGGF